MENAAEMIKLRLLSQPFSIGYFLFIAYRLIAILGRAPAETIMRAPNLIPVYSSAANCYASGPYSRHLGFLP